MKKDDPQETEHQKIAQEILSLIKNKISTSDIFSRASRWVRQAHPFSTWDVAKAVSNDLVNNEHVVDEILKLATLQRNPTYEIATKNSNNSPDDSVQDKFDNPLSSEDRAKNQRYLQIISLSAKNRAESLTDRADFYPVFATVLTAASAVIFYFNDDLVKYVGSAITVGFIINAVTVRLRTKTQIAELKMLANVLDLVDKRFPKSP
ncbi:hypothetical protein LJR039_005292 [Pseudorhodoferax sp. LjRoot39]|uniref:hypothetical protein n=1 Tax=Pseudorhodoferax sp. LjRoot39 TaxID=3342328 RepID=UPI003ECEB94C